MRYLNYTLLGFVFILAYLFGLFITPINYYIKDFVRKYNIMPLWIFLNDTKKINQYDIDYGDFGRFEHNFKGFYRQNAIRNSHWNLKLLLAPKKGNKENVNGILEWRRYNLKGFQFATYEIKETKYFRFSYSKTTKKYNLPIISKWKYFVIPVISIEKVSFTYYFQFGASDNRYIYKFKIKTWQ